MIKFILSFLISVSVFSQTESTTADNNVSEETPLSTNTSLVGYKFWEGGFMNTRLSRTTQFHYGVVHDYVGKFKVLEVPLIIKQRLNTNFHTFIGARLNSTINADFNPFSGPTLGASYEFGLQYDVNKNFMLEMRYSLPRDQNKEVYPVQMEYNNQTLFRLGSEFRF